MRKGRSHRKTRGSLPPLSSRAQSALGAGPQVVIGLTNPPRSSVEDAPTAETRGIQADAPPPLDLVREAERLEQVREKNLEIVRESLDLVRESLALAAETSPSEQSPAEEPAIDEPVSPSPEIAVAAASSELAEATTEDDVPEAEPTDPTELGAAPAFELIESDPPPALALARVSVHTTALPTPDEVSIPPVGDLAVEPVAERFFSEGELASARGAQEDEEETWDHAPDKGQRKSLPHVVERRARFAKYVRWAVGGAAVVCLAALARTAVVPSTKSVPSHASVAALEAPAAKAATPAVTAPGLVSAPTVAVPKAPEPAAEPAQAAPVAAAPAVEPTTPQPAAEPAKPAGDKTALEEKKDARRALERGKTQDAIDAGERSVALDPTDGEAWLLLGAAYQDKGKIAEARRCYSACAKEGKRGPLGECRAMLRF